MQTKLYFLCYCYILLLVGCNSSVFIDDIRPSTNEITLNGDGDSLLISFPSSDWNIEYLPTIERKQWEIYDMEGEYLESADYMKGLGKALLKDGRIEMCFERKHGNELFVRISESIKEYSLDLPIRNDYEEHTIKIHILPCSPYTLDTISYTLDNYQYNGNEWIDKYGMVVNNANSSSPFTFYLKPYQDESHKVQFISDQQEAFTVLGTTTPQVEIPSPKQGTGQLEMKGEIALFKELIQELPLPYPTNDSVKVVVEPGKHQHVYPIVDYDKYEIGYVMQAHNTKSMRKISFTGKLHSQSPSRYFIVRKNIEPICID